MGLQFSIMYLKATLVLHYPVQTPWHVETFFFFVLIPKAINWFIGWITITAMVPDISVHLWLSSGFIFFCFFGHYIRSNAACIYVSLPWHNLVYFQPFDLIVWLCGGRGHRQYRMISRDVDVERPLLNGLLVQDHMLGWNYCPTFLFGHAWFILLSNLSQKTDSM